MLRSYAGLHEPGLGFRPIIARATDEIVRFSFPAGKDISFSLPEACFCCFQDNGDGIWTQVLSAGTLQRLAWFCLLGLENTR